MSVHIAHFVLEPLRHADYEVVDDSFDGAEGCYILSGAMVQLNNDRALVWM